MLISNFIKREIQILKNYEKNYQDWHDNSSVDYPLKVPEKELKKYFDDYRKYWLNDRRR